MTTVFMIIGAAVLIFLAVLLIRAAMFTPKPERERSQETVAEMGPSHIQCSTFTQLFSRR